jgi:esterase/lipase superfamily enzyme
VLVDGVSTSLRILDRDYHRWYSPNFGRDMELLVFGRGGARVLAFRPRLGRFYDYENWGVVESLRRHVEAGWIQLFCLDSIDAEDLHDPCRHPRDRLARHEQYERYALDEVLGFSGWINPGSFVTALVCSLGAYHAANIVLRSPHRFGKLVALSGRFDLTRAAEHFGDLFGGYYDQSVYFHTLCHFVPNLHDAAQLAAIRRLEIVFAVGEDDPSRESNHQVSTALWEKGAWNVLHIRRGRAHRASDWR